MQKAKKSTFKTMLSVLLLIAVLASSLPMGVWADAAGDIAVTEGDILRGFAEAGTVCQSSDPAVAWVDESGDLRALREGTATITVGDESRTVTVADYTDGSEIVGQLKLLARFNDTMQFYDGHVYLLFTSYKDDVTVSVPDLYAGYEISDLYYYDISHDISAGSNHTGSDAEKYFTLSGDMSSVTLDRGEIVTIGMYRDFDMSIYQAALGSITHSTLFNNVSDEIKAYIIEALFSLLTGGQDEERESSLDRFIAELTENGIDYNDVLDGAVNGGVCFNRELYNQKLEWDQFENATYELDITENQLAKLTEALSGNLNKFSILKNSCATVALRAWNHAVGTRDGEKTAYYLDPTGSGVFALIDAPKTVKSEIVSKLPGYYANKSDSTEDEAEPNAGFYDDTGWVYVSAPETLDPPAFSYGDGLHVFVTGQPKGAETSVYYKDENGEKVFVDISDVTQIPAGTVLYISAVLEDFDFDHIVSSVAFNGESILDTYDKDEQAYTATMTEGAAVVSVVYATAEVSLSDGSNYYIQIPVGTELKVSDYASYTVEGRPSDELIWTVEYQEPENTVEFTDDTNQTVIAKNAGKAELWAQPVSNTWVGTPFYVEVYDESADLVKVTYNTPTLADFSLVKYSEYDEFHIPHSGYLVENGTVLSLETNQYQPSVFAGATANGEPVEDLRAIKIDGDTEIEVEFRKAEITNLPEIIRIDEDGTYQLEAAVRYSELCYRNLPVYDPTVTYECHDDDITIDENGLLTVTGEIGEEGKCVIVRAVAGSSGGTVYKDVKVVVGNYDGDRIVGRLTIYARPLTERLTMYPHVGMAFTTYEDVDLDVSTSEYYKPSEEYKELMADYRDNPDNFASDPAIYSDELDLGDRASYFERICEGANSPVQRISLKAGEGITFSYYPLDSHIDILMKAFTNGTIANTPHGQVLIRQLQKYLDKEEIDGAAAFDALLQTAVQMLTYSAMTGYNPADGRCAGGLAINREMYNLFVLSGIPAVNSFYTVELTADEFAVLQSDFANPENNYYTLFNKNCGNGCTDLWNKVLSDRPSLYIKGNYTGFIVDPISIYVDIGRLPTKTGEYFDGTGEGGGRNFVPHIAPAYETEEYVLGDINGDGFVDNIDVVMLARYLVHLTVLEGDSLKAADMDADGTISNSDLVFLARKMVSQ